MCTSTIVSRESLRVSVVGVRSHLPSSTYVARIHGHEPTHAPAHDRCISFALWARPLSLDRGEAERSSAEPLGTGDCRLCFEEHALSAAAGIFCNLRLPSDFQIGSAADRPGRRFFRTSHDRPAARCFSRDTLRRSISREPPPARCPVSLRRDRFDRRASLRVDGYYCIVSAFPRGRLSG